MRYFSMLLISFIVTETYAQTIPYASQQPQWVFPIYAKDATGKRDTIYFGFDENANASISENNFGEIWFSEPASFFLSVYNGSGSIKKANIQDTLNEGFYFEFNIGNAIFPLTFYWDANLLRSDSLPFPNQPSFPNGWMEISFSGPWYFDNDLTGSCSTSLPILVSDTGVACLCSFEDSVVLANGDTTAQSSTFHGHIKPWHNCYAGMSERKENEINVFPSPNYDWVLNIETPVGKGVFDFSLINITGKVVYSSELHSGNTILKIPETITSGVYLCGIRNNEAREMASQRIVLIK